jgi:phosphoribosylformylglycinamidine synthase II
MITVLSPNPDPFLNQAITPELVERHGLLPDEYETIVRTLGREANLTELGIFSVMWSEHCSYKNSRPVLKLFPTQKAAENPDIGRVLVKAGEENAGVIDIGDGWAVAFKIESHNHPSFVEPFEGAATGVGGIIRDIFTMGARPVLLTNSLRFGELECAEVRNLVRGVVSGIAHYGNCIGIPNIGGDIYFDSCYNGNPLVNAQCLGILRHDQIKRGAASGTGNPVYYVGAPTGRDGLGGASFASRELSEESQADRPAVQKGDPFMEKLLLEACLEMMEIPDLVVGIQDMGAAGLTCSTCETASRGRTGIEIDLDLVPQRETGMNSYEIMLSESQERMLVIVKKGRESEIDKVFEKWDLHAVQVGQVTDGDRMIVRQNGVVVADIPALALTDEAPVYNRVAVEPAYLEKTWNWRPELLAELDSRGVESTLPILLDHPTIGGKQWVWRQYDHMVMAGTVVEPGSDAGVVCVHLGKEKKYLAMANDGNGRYCYLDPYRGGVGAVAECVRNLACTGARALAVTDNLNFGNPNKPEVFYTFRESVRGLSDACRAYDLPVVGGNVSFYNENQAGAIDPTPVVSVVGLIEDPENVTRQFCQNSGEKVILIGGLPDELGGSQYLKIIHNLKVGRAPKVDMEVEQKQNAFLLSEIGSERVVAAHDLSEGGLLVALTEMLLESHGLGMDLSVDPGTGRRFDSIFFGESQGRILISVNPEFEETVLSGAKAIGVVADTIGQVNDVGQLKVCLGAAGDSVQWSVDELREIWEKSIEKRMERSGLVQI